MAVSCVDGLKPVPKDRAADARFVLELDSVFVKDNGTKDGLRQLPNQSVRILLPPPALCPIPRLEGTDPWSWRLAGGQTQAILPEDPS